AIHPDDRAAVEAANMAVITEKKAAPLEYRVVTSNGDVRTVFAETGELELDESGKPDILHGVVQDITDRKKIEEALLASETRYRRLFEAAKDGILILDAETGMVVDVNPFLVKLLGYDAKEFLGKAIWELGFLKNVIASKNNFLELQTDGYVRYEDLPVETSDGRKIDVEFVSNVYGVDHQKVIQCNIRDITARKKTEDALKESQEQYRALVDNANEAILVAQDGLIKFVNRTTFNLFPGYSENELVNRPLTDFIHPDDRARSIENFLKRVNRQYLPDRHQYRLVMHDGSIRWAEVGATLIEWKGKPATLNFITDVTVNVEAEKVLRESETRFRTLIEKSPVGIILSRNSICLYVNEKALRIFGLEQPEQAVGKLVQEFLSPQTRKESQERARRRALGPPTIDEFETIGLRPDGSHFPISVTVEFIKLPDGFANMSFVTDITERKKAE
ncbi:MAG TPA: PAS domain S-box protein, partial [Bacteroidota bacterium]|nr:PAS domain S-box protein [Bacteroidota bacterium]